MGGFQRPPPPADSPYKPSTTVLLKDQQQLITDLKQNFQRDMFELKQQMVQQQQMFQDQLQKLAREQSESNGRKEQAELEVQRLRLELENKKQEEAQQQKLYQLALQAGVAQPSQNGPNPSDIMRKYGSAQNTRKPSAREDRRDFGENAR